MSTKTTSKSKSAGTKMTVKEKKRAQMVANRRAQLQWYALGGVLAVAIVVTIVLVSVLTEPNAPVVVPSGL
jgi:uncharacterized membrane protein YcjF (UPF0283 family)